MCACARLCVCACWWRVSRMGGGLPARAGRRGASGSVRGWGGGKEDGREGRCSLGREGGKGGREGGNRTTLREPFTSPVHKCTHTRARARVHTHTHTSTRAHARTRSCSLSLTHTAGGEGKTGRSSFSGGAACFSLSLSYTHTHTLSLSHTHTHAHARTHTLSWRRSREGRQNACF